MTVLRRIIGSTLFWMLFWAGVGAMLSIVVGIVDPPSIDAGEGPIDLARILGGVGAASGALFGLVLAVVERKRTTAEVPVLRALLWGALAGAAVGLLLSAPVVNTCPLGAATGVAQVLIARLSRRLKPATATV
ncbi:MAG TPA: hypothetical protein VJY35_00765 [Candidatus Eisenbacteria bacterium]|nr:hypothetical protein [Candidatus Eisenbacteria bacterium]